MTELRELLDLPTEVRRSDFVVRLSEGVQRGEALLAQTALTPGLLQAFDAALGKTAAALRENRSWATYVHGSFGSGKSHFMALLSLMLGNDAAVWAEPGFHALYAKHEWVKSKKLLRLHFHMVGAQSVEDKVFGEYLARIRAEHPEAPLPALFKDQQLFDNAEQLRGALGSEAFFAALNRGQGHAPGWGRLQQAATWDAASFAAARASTDREERARLFSSLAQTLFPAFTATGAWVGFDEGLGVLTRHAKELGYAGVVLFLDELVLWLASRAANIEFLQAEVQKLAKLVEAQDAGRPIPVLSFVARQRDISELVGKDYVGRDATTLQESLRWWEGRFDTITLEDRNLPAVIQKRVVRPRDAAARQRLDEAFGQMRRNLGQAWGTLLGDIGDDAGFRQVYPFSPALIEAIVALSNGLQRERTALRVLVELLVEHLKDFEMGRVVPIGDLFDVLAGGEEPMDGQMREAFLHAKRIYAQQLLPAIQAESGTGSKERCQRLRDEHRVSLGCSNCRELRCRADNRLVKTLLLASLVPQLNLFRTLTVTRLVQLNHGTLKAPVAGNEAAQATARLKKYAAEVGKLRVGDQGDPSVTIELGDVDVGPILAQARVHDSTGARRSKLNEVLFDLLGLPVGAATVRHDLEWRNTRRLGTVRFGNVREMEDSQLTAGDDDAFLVVIDYPFDDAGHSPTEDEARLNAFLEKGKAQPAVAWLPSFFGERLQNELGQLVAIDHVLSTDFRRYVELLRPEAQLRARTEIENLQSAKKNRIKRVLAAAYGITNSGADELDAARSVEQHFVLLSGSEPLRNVVSVDLAGALRDAASEVLNRRYPRHPHFGNKVTRPQLEKALKLLETLVGSEGQRMTLAQPERKELEVAQDLGLVQLSEGAAQLRLAPFQELQRALEVKNLVTPQVGAVRRELDPHGVFGLTPEVQDFRVLSFALVSGHELLRGGRPLAERTLGKLPEDAELVRPAMPEAAKWQRALELANSVLVITLGGRALNARNLRALSERLDEARRTAERTGAGRIAALLLQQGDLVARDAPRLKTAEKAVELVALLANNDVVGRVEHLAAFVAETSPAALQRHFAEAEGVTEVLQDELVLASLRDLAARSEQGA